MSEFKSEEDNTNNIESPSVIFPDRVNMSCRKISFISKKSVPKLDVTKVHAKFEATSMKFEKIHIKFNRDNNSDHENDDKIDIPEEEIKLKKIKKNCDNKIKSELKNFEKLNDKLKLKVD